MFAVDITRDEQPSPDTPPPNPLITLSIFLFSFRKGPWGRSCNHRWLKIASSVMSRQHLEWASAAAAGMHRLHRHGNVRAVRNGSAWVTTALFWHLDVWGCTHISMRGDVAQDGREQERAEWPECNREELLCDPCPSPRCPVLSGRLSLGRRTVATQKQSWQQKNKSVRCWAIADVWLEEAWGAHPDPSGVGH